jgi:signal transduction histidine kinase
MTAEAEAAGWRGPAGPLRRVFGPVVSARTWLALIHLLAGAVTGAVAFAVVVALAVAGFGTLWLFLAGVPLLAAMAWVCTAFAQAERLRFAVMLGVQLPAPPPDLAGDRSRWAQVRQLFVSPVRSREAGYALLRLPLSLAESALVVAAWAAAVAAFVLPLFSFLLLRVRWHIGRAVPNPWLMAVVSVAGFLLLLAVPHLTRGLAVADTAVARFFIGPGGSEAMTTRIGQLERSRARLADSAEAERRRIERDLHDGAQQRLVSLAMNLGRAKARYASDPEAAIQIIGQAHAEALEALAELRNLVRGVHPPVLTDRGLDAAISGLAALCPVPVEVRVEVAARPGAAIEAIAYFVVAEALTNVAKHARAARAEVTIVRRGPVLHLLISDDGVGGADPQGQGLAGLADRVTGLDGRLLVHSPSGGPTVIEVDLPCAS